MLSEGKEKSIWISDLVLIAMVLVYALVVWVLKSCLAVQPAMAWVPLKSNNKLLPFQWFLHHVRNVWELELIPASTVMGAESVEYAGAQAGSAEYIRSVDEPGLYVRT